MSEKSSMLSGAEVMAAYADTFGKKKAGSSALKLFLLGIVSGLIIGLSAVAAGAVTHAIQNAGTARLVAGLIFPFGLGIIMLLGTELFTGNTMIFISVLNKSASVAGMIKNWLCVYFGNMVGSVIIALGIVYSGQLSLSRGTFAVYAISTAALKSSLSFGPAFMLGFLCNILVCLGVLCSLTAKGTTGRILGAYIPVALFIMGGFEHCVANMYYIPAGIFAMANPTYAALAAQAGINTAALGWQGFVMNLLPVTMGNILGGVFISTLLWAAHRGK